MTLDPADVERKISPHTKAIMPVHMRGAMARMDAILEIAKRHGLRVIEDCAQGNGASFQGRRLGSMGDVGCFSLQFSKIITTGEGGMVTTSDQQVWQRAFMFHDVAAWNRLDIPDVEVLWGANFPDGGDAGGYRPGATGATAGHCRSRPGKEGDVAGRYQFDRS